MTTRLRRGPRAALITLLLSVALSGCSMLSGNEEDPAAEPSASPTPTETPYDSQFTRDGTFQSHIDINGVDFVYTLYPTKSTPRTNEWFPRGNKFFSFTFQAYDLDRALRDPYRTKRKVYLEQIKVTSITKTAKGRGTSRPYALDAEARRITFDPEPLTTKYGMAITSPKGAFELRNQRIRPMPLDTRGVDLMFTATVWVQESPGSDRFTKREIKQTVPISIFESDQPTKVARIPVNAN
ncbi:hypothetical protein NPS01_03990 [Nocardioides psychrotolerans]|uniref:Lipoprotein n=1 Tax=Nocardioides psychrotolerans TaxID=1005945 RepID=A0A1I3BCF1_9ACTN|nr:hypothetical protein [Nocardioides psychrotolerans]GEP36736.1 hypothetical protein NPS01_03990 [Nocardioides psychrotolerans]SFH59619.1 hypothetical protein SAMN05216561_10140 [Nocardioides psychrotolerans]